MSTAQHTQIDAVLLAESKLLDLKQTTSVVNNSSKPLDTLFFYNWANAFSHNQTILAERIRSNYDKSFHFANTNLKGFTHITDIFEKGSNQQLDFKFLNDDILAVVLSKPLTSKKSITLDFSYQVKIPSSQFTGFGFNKKDNFNLRFWYIDPIPLGIENKTLLHNIGQQFRKSTLQKFEVNLKINKDYSLFTSLPYTVDIEKNHKNYKINGRLNCDLQLLIQKENEFNSYMFQRQ